MANTMPTNLCIKWGLYLVHRYYDGKHKLCNIEKEPLSIGTASNRTNIHEDIQRGFDILKLASEHHTTEWPSKVELHVKISNLWD